MKVRIKSAKTYVGLDHLVGKTFDAVKVNSDYSGYYVDVEIIKGKTSSLYFLPWEVEEVDEVIEKIHDYQSAISLASISVFLIAVILMIILKFVI
jgi:hypothetical protein